MWRTRRAVLLTGLRRRKQTGNKSKRAGSRDFPPSFLSSALRGKDLISELWPGAYALAFAATGGDVRVRRSARRFLGYRCRAGHGRCSRTPGGEKGVSGDLQGHGLGAPLPPFFCSDKTSQKRRRSFGCTVSQKAFVKTGVQILFVWKGRQGFEKTPYDQVCQTSWREAPACLSRRIFAPSN